MTLGKDAYAAHKLVWRAFPSKPGTMRDFLFRRESENEQLGRLGMRSSTPVFYVVSKRPPVAVDPMLIVEPKPYEPRLKAGQRFVFDLRANPVVSRMKEEDRNANRADGRKRRTTKHDILMDAKHRAKRSGVDNPGELERLIEKMRSQAVLEWFQRQCDRYGCALIDQNMFEVNGYRQHALARRDGNPIRFSSVDITGVVEIDNPVTFRTALFDGVGRSKSFGCGLLLVRRY